MRFGVVLGLLIAAMTFSAGMTYCTMALAASRTEQPPEIVAAISYERLSPRGLASALARALGDDVVGDGKNSTVLYCTKATFDTAHGNTIQVVHCGRDLGFIAYHNEQNLTLKPFSETEDVVDSMLSVMKEVSSSPSFNATFSVESFPSSLDPNAEQIKAYQYVGEWRFVWSGFFLRRDYDSRIVRLLVIYNAYGGAPEAAELPPPNYEALRKLVEQRGLQYLNQSTYGLKACGSRLAYSVIVFSEVPRSMYQALIDAYTGEVLSLASIRGFRVYDLIESSC